MKPLYILKIGGSVATFKDEAGGSVRLELLEKIALAIKKIQAKKDFSLVLVHGAGSVGHNLARKHELDKGTNGDKKKLQNALFTCVANQEMDNMIAKIFLFNGIKAFPVHTASTIIQKNKKISYCNTEIIKQILEKDCVPVLYGEMVMDFDLEMSVCSGDAIVAYLAKHLGAQKIFFASDIDGVFDKDPYFNKDAKLIEKTKLSEIFNDDKIEITHSHNVDVTGGMLGKIRSLEAECGNALQTIEIFNGLKEENYEKIFSGKKFPHTTIKNK